MAKEKKQEIKTVMRSEKDDRKFHFKATVWGEIRTVADVVVAIKDKENKDKVTEYHSLELGLDDEDGERFYLTDKDMSHADMYKRGVTGTFTVRIDVEEGFKAQITKSGKEIVKNGIYKIYVTDFVKE